jgi:hypothetical protein
MNNDDSKPIQPMGKSLADRVTPAVVYRLPGMDRVRVISNLQYTDVGNPHLLLDVYVPPDLEVHERRPVIVCLASTITFVSDDHFFRVSSLIDDQPSLISSAWPFGLE